MGWSREGYEGHEGYVIAVEGTWPHRRIRELGETVDAHGERAVSHVQVECACGWRSPRFLAPMGTTWAPSIVQFPSHRAEPLEDYECALWSSHLADWGGHRVDAAIFGAPVPPPERAPAPAPPRDDESPPAWRGELEAAIAEWEKDGAEDAEHHPYAARMRELAIGFHELRGLPGLRPWSPLAFARAALLEPRLSGPSQLAAVFVLKVWNQQFPCPAFDVLEALSRWDAEHRAAFTLWAEAPFWP